MQYIGNVEKNYDDDSYEWTIQDEYGDIVASDFGFTSEHLATQEMFNMLDQYEDPNSGYNECWEHL